MATCTSCQKSPAPHQTPTGRLLCDSCYTGFARTVGVAGALGDGASPGQAVVTGVATGAWAGSTKPDPQPPQPEADEPAQRPGLAARLRKLLG